MATTIEETTKPAAPAKGGVKVTDKALAKVRTAIVKEGISPEQGGLRLGVQGGGCSGLSYNIRFDTQPRERDRIFEFGDVRVFVDPKSFIYLNGMVLDYQETLMQQGFVFVNPNASKSCGCGTSLRVKFCVVGVACVATGDSPASLERQGPPRSALAFPVQ